MSLEQSFDTSGSNKDLPQKAEPYIPHSGLMCVVDHLLKQVKRTLLQWL